VNQRRATQKAGGKSFGTDAFRSRSWYHRQPKFKENAMEFTVKLFIKFLEDALKMNNAEDMKLYFLNSENESARSSRRAQLSI
jgi:hypothetical protein